MSAQHTPGRMELVSCNCGGSRCNRYGTSIGTFYHGNGYALPDAQRVADCWNACEGIADPSVVPELVAALEDVTRFHRGEGEYDFRRLTAHDRANATYDAWQAVLGRIDAAFAKARGAA